MQTRNAVFTSNQSLSSTDIFEYFKSISIDKDWSFSQFKPSETSKWTHGYHHYPAKFIPQLVEKLFDEFIFSDEANINDPFMGSGTTIVSAISRGYKVSGTDINRIAVLLTEVKATPIEPVYLNKKITRFLIKAEDIIENYSTLLSQNIEPLIPQKHIDRINYWFNESNKIELGKLLRLIEKESDKVIKNFLKVAFSHILKSCSMWLQTSTKPTKDKNKIPSNVYDALKRHLKRMERGNKAFWETTPVKVKHNISEYLSLNCSDAISQPDSDNSVDLIVSSSPYVTSYEYADLHQLSTIWLDFADDLTEYKKKFIGTSYKKYENEKLKSEIAQTIVDGMSQKSNKMSKEIEAFFIDMQNVFNESYRILKNGGRCCFVIGNTKLKSVDILNAEVFVESLQYSGFYLDRIIKREIPSKILPQKREATTGRFAKNGSEDFHAYPTEYIIIMKK